MIARRAFLAWAVAGIAASGCDRLLGKASSPFKSIDITGTSLGGDLALDDHHGKPRTLADFRGKVVLVNFGFTHCPDVCPTTLAELAAAMKRLGPDASRVQVLFVTVDPKRDTPELLRQYVPAFHPDFLGLRGDDAATTRTTKSFGVYAAIQEGPTPENYNVNHSAQSFVFDPQGRLRLMVPPGLPAETIASDLRLLLNG